MRFASAQTFHHSGRWCRRDRCGRRSGRWRRAGDVNYAPLFRFCAAAGVAGVFAQVELDGVAEFYREGLRFGIEGADVFLLFVRVSLRSLALGARGFEGGEQGSYFGGAGEGHREIGRAFGGLAGGFTTDDFLGGLPALRRRWRGPGVCSR